MGVEADFERIWQRAAGGTPIGHSHFAARALSRRTFLSTLGLAGGAAFVAPALGPLLSVAGATAPAFSPPNPLNGGTVLPFQGLTGFYFPDAVEAGTGDPSLIRDFNGFVGLGDFVEGSVAGGTNTWKADMRFMKGLYVGVDGMEHHGAFAFI